MTTLNIILGILGALGGFVMVRDYASRRIRAWRHWRELRATPSDFYYHDAAICVRVSRSGTRWQTFRRETVRVSADGLPGIDIGLLPKNSDVCTKRVSPADLKIDERDEFATGLTRVFITPKEPLNKKQSLIYEFECDFEKAAESVRKGDRLTWVSTRRVDQLTLRAVFSENSVREVRFKILDASGRVLHDEPVRLDPTSYEARYHVRAPQRNLTYALLWEYVNSAGNG
jgi:hypothetical protein